MPYLSAPRRRFLLAAAGLALAGPSGAVQAVSAWNYYPSPPFVLEKGGGLVADLIGYLNAALAPRYMLELSFLPRARLTLALQARRRGVIVLAPSTVFVGRAYADFAWSAPIMADRQELVSLASRPVEFTSADGLVGLRLGAIRGHVYPALQDAIQKGRLVPHLVANEEQLLDMLLAGRLDAMTLGASTLDYFLKQRPGVAPSVHRSSRSLDNFTRHLLFTPGLEALRDASNDVLRKAHDDPRWLALFRTYGLAPAAAEVAAWASGQRLSGRAALRSPGQGR